MHSLKQKTIKVNPKTAATVMLVSGGYPEDYEKRKIIKGLESVCDDCLLFHAGTARNNEQTVTSGGRVIAVTALAENMESALAKANEQAEKITFDRKYFRKDIGFDLKVSK